MPRFLVCSNSQIPISGGGILASSNSYGEYNNLKEAMKRLKEVANTGFKLRDEVTKYFVNELAPPNTYPVVAKTYPLS
jgi:galactose-1-phosphate uridylyltransferase